jgi:Amidase
MADRRAFLNYFASAGLGSTLLPGVLWSKVAEAPSTVVTLKMLQDAAAVAGVGFTDEEFERMLKGVNENLAKYDAIRATPLDNSIAPPLYFNPIVPGMKIDREKRGFRRSEPPRVSRPANVEQVAFWPVTQLGELLRTKQVKSVELTEMYLARLKRYNPKLLCAVTITEELALRQAREADEEIAAGRYRGPLHGVPYGVKDLAAAKGYPTTWGAAPFKDRVIDEDATVVSRLRQAGAVLVAKLATGELALDDVWFAGQTKNPWDLSMG